MAEGLKSAEVGGREAGYLFEFKPDGVFLTVYPTGDSGMLFELSDMRQILKEYGVMDYDMGDLAHVVRAADGNPFLLAQRFEASVAPPDPNAKRSANEEIPAVKAKPENGIFMKFQIEVSKDRMTATMKIDRQPGQIPPAKEDVLKELSSRRIVFGIDEDAIERGLAHGSQTVIVRGKPPEPGKDAKIVRKFNAEQKGKLQEDKYGRVDYKNLNLFLIAKKGDILAERIPHTLGVEGVNIFGDKIKPKPGKPKPVPAGKNTEIKDDNFVVAAIDGQIVEANNKFSVDPRLEIRGDVSVGTGNINFVGAVSIGGNVLQGFSVKATGNVEINGGVNGGMVEGFNVFVKGGVIGVDGKGKVTAEEDVQAAFVENGAIEAGGIITVTDVVLHSDLRAGIKIVVEGKRGLVTGGYLAAGEEIRAKVIGNQAQVASRLVVGVNPSLQRKYQDACREYSESRKKLQQLTQALNTLGKIDVSLLPPQRAEQIAQLTRSQFPLAGQVERSERLIKELEEQISQMKNGRICVSDRIFPGQKLIVNSVVKHIQQEEQHCSFQLEDDEVRVGPYY
ncbi:MAG: DUF342 domain-containing protein [Schwartzia sp.]|nr:DUF342 domain-containing protein [Schwartzia sp. (in: firmicutes)]